MGTGEGANGQQQVTMRRHKMQALFAPLQPRTLSTSERVPMASSAPSILRASGTGAAGWAALYSLSTPTRCCLLGGRGAGRKRSLRLKAGRVGCHVLIQHAHQVLRVGEGVVKGDVGQLDRPQLTVQAECSEHRTQACSRHTFTDKHTLFSFPWLL